MNALAKKVEQLEKKINDLQCWNEHLAKKLQTVEKDIDLAMDGGYDSNSPFKNAYAKIASMAVEHKQLIQAHGKPHNNWKE